MTIKDLKKEIDRLVKEGHGKLPVTEVNGESGYMDEINSMHFQYPIGALGGYDRTKAPISLVLTTWLKDKDGRIFIP